MKKRSDIYSKKRRSEIMSLVSSKNTKPEIQIRSALHRLGYRFRIHRKDLLGYPDIVLPKYEAVIFVHGCFWHQHEGCKKATIPENNHEFWLKKLQGNIERDRKNISQLVTLGWKVIIVWECDIKKDMENVIKKIEFQLKN
jgi:DNA mismatch endonuclease (patch repair protein)